MSDMSEMAAAMAAQQALAEPEDDEAGDAIVFVRNGWIRFTIAGVMYKLRRPFLGELRQLEGILDHASEELKLLAEDMRERETADRETADRIKTEVEAGDVSEVRRAELDDEATQLAVNLQVRMLEVSRKGRDLREQWYLAAFEMLTPPGHTSPPSMPAWVGDAQMQAQIIMHWQSAPLAPGNG